MFIRKRFSAPLELLDRLKADAPVTAIHFVRKMHGGSQSSLIACSDGLHYVVKAFPNPQGPHLLANEMLGTVLSETLNLPVPHAVPVYLSKTFIEQNANHIAFETRAGRYPPTEGLHFGSRVVIDPSGFNMEYLSPSTKRYIADRPHALGMFILDLWAYHRDRRQLICTGSNFRQRTKATYIDHGAMFGGAYWSFGRSDFAGTSLLDLSPQLLEAGCTARWIKKFRRLLPSALSVSLSLLPAQWFAGDLSFLETTLLQRLDRLEDIVGAHPLVSHADRARLEACSSREMTQEGFLPFR